MSLTYSIFDPTGNLTILVETDVEPARQPEVAAMLMRRHPEVEQVGFVRGTSLRMAGGEFCGNATMSAAALYALRGGPTAVAMRVFGAAAPVKVCLRRETDTSFFGSVEMPPALDIIEKDLMFEHLQGSLPVVYMEGISHIVICSDSPFYALMQRRADAERAVRQWNKALASDGLGLMFLHQDSAACHMIPLVYVPGSDTVFWEHSCASGSAAVGMALHRKTGAPIHLTLHQPGGSLCVDCDESVRLHGSVRLLKTYNIL